MSVLKIPEGYQWCKECNALTPHEIYDNGKWGADEKSCVICGNHDFKYSACPNCGWEHDPDNDIGPDPMVKAHKEGCKFFDMQYDLELYRENFDKEEDCDCPEHKIYPYTLIRNYNSWSGHCLDCSNHQEWSYDVHCPVCGEEFYVTDGNC